MSIHCVRAVRMGFVEGFGNLRTHGVSFAEAITALEDDLALTREDVADGEEQRAS